MPLKQHMQPQTERTCQIGARCVRTDTILFMHVIAAAVRVK
jgi:hypothetical protein